MQHGGVIGTEFGSELNLHLLFPLQGIFKGVDRLMIYSYARLYSQRINHEPIMEIGKLN